MMYSVNNHLILETYTKEALKPKLAGGIATPGQRDAVKGLMLLMDANLPDGRHIPKGSYAYFREEALHTHGMFSKHYNCVTIPGNFIIVETSLVEFYVTPGDAA